MPGITDRRQSERYKSIGSGLRLALELVAIVWAVAGLNNATSSLKEALIEVKVNITKNTESINDLITRVRIIESKQKNN